jgi:hypothetical protein
MNLDHLPPHIQEGHRRSREIYERFVKPTLKPEDDWQFVTIDIHSGDYEMDHDSIASADRLRLRRPNGSVLARAGWGGDGLPSWMAWPARVAQMILSNVNPKVELVVAVPILDAAGNSTP